LVGGRQGVQDKVQKFHANLMIEPTEEIDIFLEENSAEDEKDNYSLSITAFFSL
jgi:hypothetical protein